MTIRSFDSFEEAQKAMAEGIAYGNANLATAQTNLTYGSTFVEFVPELLAERIVVFGQVLTLDEIREGCLTHGGTPAEAETEMAQTEADHEVGMLFSRAWSVVDPRTAEEGELGSKHRFNIWPIPSTLFEAARQVGWDMDALPIENKMGLAMIHQAWRAHMIAVMAADAQKGEQ